MASVLTHVEYGCGGNVRQIPSGPSRRIARNTPSARQGPLWGLACWTIAGGCDLNAPRDSGVLDGAETSTDRCPDGTRTSPCLSCLQSPSASSVESTFLETVACASPQRSAIVRAHVYVRVPRALDRLPVSTSPPSRSNAGKSTRWFHHHSSDTETHRTELALYLVGVVSMVLYSGRLPGHQHPGGSSFESEWRSPARRWPLECN